MPSPPSPLSQKIKKGIGRERGKLKRQNALHNKP
jgi:hypothetical protein